MHAYADIRAVRIKRDGICVRDAVHDIKALAGGMFLFFERQSGIVIPQAQLGIGHFLRVSICTGSIALNMSSEIPHCSAMYACGILCSVMYFCIF